jgi:hypothetical protein
MMLLPSMHGSSIVTFEGVVYSIFTFISSNPMQFSILFIVSLRWFTSFLIVFNVCSVLSSKDKVSFRYTNVSILSFILLSIILIISINVNIIRSSLLLLV